MSDKQKITSGVLQGSILGPLLFILLVNDLHLHVFKCDLNLYADDTHLYIIGKTVSECKPNCLVICGSVSVVWN